jgi:lipopolysaccharide/colanic/teichoic acid biosynthesis glycosyltransferase
MTTLLPQQLVAFGERGMCSKADKLWGNSRGKRLVDVVGSLVGLCIAGPIALAGMALLAAGRKRSAGWWKVEDCVGKGTSPFRQFSFNIDDVSDRLVWVKFFMLRWGLDRVPQLWNVLGGEMSLVGPEAGSKKDLERYRWEIPAYGVRHLVRPGLTGKAQISGWGGKRNVRKRAVIDSTYVREASLKQDLAVIFRALAPGLVYGPAID